MKGFDIFKTKEGKLNLRYAKIFELIHTGKNKFYLKRWTGSYKHRTLNDTDYWKMKEVLDNLKIAYKEGNDAPRGGVAGDYILITARTTNQNYKTILDKGVDLYE